MSQHAAPPKHCLLRTAKVLTVLRHALLGRPHGWRHSIAREGFKAFRAGLPVTVCPYRQRDLENEWRDGWSAGLRGWELR